MARHRSSERPRGRSHAGGRCPRPQPVVKVRLHPVLIPQIPINSRYRRIPLTPQVTPYVAYRSPCSVPISERLSSNAGRVRESLRERGRVPSYLVASALAGRGFDVRSAEVKAWPVRTVLLQCAACGRQTSVTAGTIFQDTRTPLPTWLRAMWWVGSQKTGRVPRGSSRCWVRELRDDVDLGCTSCGGRWCGPGATG
jgi:hypothetical protein